jgi:hypothetical protein
MHGHRAWLQLEAGAAALARLLAASAPCTLAAAASWATHKPKTFLRACWCLVRTAAGHLMQLLLALQRPFLLANVRLCTHTVLQVMILPRLCGMLSCGLQKPTVSLHLACK